MAGLPPCAQARSAASFGLCERRFSPWVCMHISVKPVQACKDSTNHFIGPGSASCPDWLGGFGLRVRSEFGEAGCCSAEAMGDCCQPPAPGYAAVGAAMLGIALDGERLPLGTNGERRGLSSYKAWSCRSLAGGGGAGRGCHPGGPSCCGAGDGDCAGGDCDCGGDGCEGEGDIGADIEESQSLTAGNEDLVGVATSGC